MYTAFHQISDLRRWAGTNLNSASFPSKVPTTTKPAASTTVGLIEHIDSHLGGNIPTWIKLMFIGLGNDNDVCSFRLIGWNRIQTGQGDGPNTLWIPQPFAEFACTFSGSTPGVANSPILATEFFADTIAPVALKLEDQKIAAGTSLLSDPRIFTPADDTVGHVIMPVRSFELIEFTCDQTTGTPTTNIIYSWLR